MIENFSRISLYASYEAGKNCYSETVKKTNSLENFFMLISVLPSRNSLISLVNFMC